MKRTGRLPHPLTGSTVGNWLRTLLRYGGRDVRWKRAARISAFVAAGAPFRLYERLCWDRKLASVEVRQPIFICGHWQSGIALVQWLLACDPRIATLRLKHAAMPAACLTMQPLLRSYLNGRVPQTRVTDNMPNHFEAPHGDDLALSLLTDVSFYHVWYFPRQADTIFQRSVLLHGLGDADLRTWLRHYRCLLQKLLIDSGRERVAVRNASNTARMLPLLTAFPDARFIFCHRDPYELFSASLERAESLTQLFSLSPHPVSPDDLAEHTLSWYEQLLRRYLADRSEIPAGRIFEAAYSDLRQRPLDVMRDLYEAFGLGGFDTARPLMEAMRRDTPWEMAGSRPLTSEQRAAVARRWAFSFPEWGYAL